MTNEDEKTPSAFIKFLLNLLKALLSGGQPFLLLLVSISSSAQKQVHLQEVNVKAVALVEQKIGVHRRVPGPHFSDGVLNQKLSFEIAQSLVLPAGNNRVKDVNLYVGTFPHKKLLVRARFFSSELGKPGELVAETKYDSCEVKDGWLQIPLLPDPIYLGCNCFVAIECQGRTAGTEQLDLQVKLGGSSTTFVRQLNEPWQQVPHHFYIYATVLVPGKWKQTPEKDLSPSLRMFSQHCRDSFSIYVSLPPSYRKHRHYPVVYLLDANAYFETLVASRAKLPAGKRPFILVGVGYSNDYLLDSLRMRDYTWPSAQLCDSCSHCGRADRFYNFLQHELLPLVKASYRVDTTRCCLAGHSLGAYFSLYALYRGHIDSQPLFQRYCAISPSLQYAEGHLLKQLQHLPASVSQQQVFIGYGSKELQDPQEQGDFKRLCTYLQAVPGIRTTQIVLPNAGHLEAALPGLLAGIGHLVNH